MKKSKTGSRWVASTTMTALLAGGMVGLAHAQARSDTAVVQDFKPAQAVVEGDVVKVLEHTYPRKIVLNGKTLEANGAAVRYVEQQTRYSGVFWTDKPIRSEQELLADNGPKRMVFTMLRPIPTERFGRRVLKGISANLSDSDKLEVMEGMSQLGQLIGEARFMKAGETFVVDWTPAHGTRMSMADKYVSQPVKGKAFYKALMGMWLGNTPAEAQFKNGLLAGWKQ